MTTRIFVYLKWMYRLDEFRSVAGKGAWED
jgi:hypothetical protein